MLVDVFKVDAFRYDFAVYNESNTQPLAYQNKMPKLDSRIKNDPAHAKLFKIYADPPTTTMQRIKAITTGSLPTFVEFSENFSSTKLDEDNFVRQLQVCVLRVVEPGRHDNFSEMEKMLYLLEMIHGMVYFRMNFIEVIFIRR